MFRYTKWTLLREILLWVYALLLLSPLFIMLNIAFKGNEEFANSTGLELVKQPTIDTFGNALSGEIGGKVLGGLAVSLGISAVAVIGLIFFASATSYVLVRKTSRMSKLAFYLMLGGIIMPQQLGMVPIYIGAKTVGLLGTPIGMGVIDIALLMPLAVVIYAGFVRTLPREYEEAAYIDGASRWRTFTRVIFPQLAPATGTVAILCGIITWNDFFSPYIYMAGSTFKPIGLVIYSWVGGYGVHWNDVFAVLTITMLPMATLYLIFQKKFIQGFAGGMKG